MASYNRVILMGNLTRDPELKFLPSGSSVANFGIAMNESYTDQQGERKDTTCFVDVEAWGRQAEVVNEYFSKGSPILIEGSLKYDSWEAEDGTKRNRLKVRLYRFQFVGGRRDEDETGGGYADAQPAAAPTQQDSYQESPEAPSTSSSTDDDIPF